MKERGRPKPAPATVHPRQGDWTRVPTAADQDGLPRCGDDEAVALLEHILGAKVIDAIRDDSRGGDRRG
jgi:hypothetical protein